MATTVARLEAILAADTKNFDRSMTRSQSRMQRVGKAGLVMGGILAGAVAVGLKKSVVAAQEAQVSQAAMERQLKALNISFGAHRDRIEETIQAHSRLSGFDDEDLQDSFTNLVRTTGNVNQALNLNATAMDLARGKHISLEAASKVLGKVYAGNTGILARYGITIQEGATATEALGIIQQKFSGQAETYGNTAQGAQDKFRVATENLQESIGQKLLPILTTLFVKLANGIQFLSGNTAQAKALRIGIIALALALATATAAQIAMNLAVLANPYVAATVAIIALAAGVALLWAKVKELRPVIALVSFYVLGLPAGITLLLAAFGKLDPVIETITGAFRRMAGWLKTVVDKVKWLIENLGKIGGALGRIPGISGGGGPSSSGTGLIPMVTNAVSAAREMGWSGQVTSGFRTYEEQAALYARYLAGGPLAAKPGTSSHEKGQAVDVTDYGTFGRMMNRLPVGLRLYNKLGARDPVHFSVTGYAKGGIVPGPIGMPQLAMVHGGETITPPGGDINLYVDGQKLFTWFRGAEAKHQRRNG